MTERDRPLRRGGSEAVTAQLGLCPADGSHCPARLCLARTLLEAQRVAGLSAPDMDVEGAARLEGCAPGCSAKFRIAPGGMKIWCDVET